MSRISHRACPEVPLGDETVVAGVVDQAVADRRGDVEVVQSAEQAGGRDLALVAQTPGRLLDVRARRVEPRHDVHAAKPLLAVRDAKRAVHDLETPVRPSRECGLPGTGLGAQHDPAVQLAARILEDASHRWHQREKRKIGVPQVRPRLPRPSSGRTAGVDRSISQGSFAWSRSKLVPMCHARLSTVSSEWA